MATPNRSVADLESPTGAQTTFLGLIVRRDRAGERRARCREAFRRADARSFVL